MVYNFLDDYENYAKTEEDLPKAAPEKLSDGENTPQQ
jgi:hypothetical protein